MIQIGSRIRLRSCRTIIQPVWRSSWITSFRRVLGREVAPCVVEIHVVERRARCRDRLDSEAGGVERREDRRDRLRAVRHARADKPPVDAHIGGAVERTHDLGSLLDAAIRVAELDGHELAAQVRLQLLGRALDDDLAAAHDRDALCEPVGLLEVVRREQDREALLLREALDLGPQRDARLRVEPGGRLVEEEHARPVDEADRDVEPPLHPAGVAARDAVGGLAAARRARAARRPGHATALRPSSGSGPGAGGSRARSPPSRRRSPARRSRSSGARDSDAGSRPRRRRARVRSRAASAS